MGRRKGTKLTTIVWDTKAFAADRQTTFGGTPVAGNKITKAKFKGQDCFIGTSGDVEICTAVEEWIKLGCKGTPKLPDDPQFAALIVVKSGDVYFMSGSTFAHSMGKTKWAIGSGADYALGAMYAGMDAKQAVMIASQLDTGTGLGVDSVSFAAPKTQTKRPSKKVAK